MVLEALLSFFTGRRTATTNNTGSNINYGAAGSSSYGGASSSSSSYFDTKEKKLSGGGAFDEREIRIQAKKTPLQGFDLIRSQVHFPVRFRKFAAPQQIEQESRFLRSVFESSSLGGLTRTYFSKLLYKLCQIPNFMSTIMFQRLVSPLGQDPATAILTSEPFMSWWNLQIQPFSSELRFFNILKGDSSRDYLTAADLRPFLRELVHTCSCLEFLRNSPVFQARYIDTILATYLYKNDRHRHGEINFEQFRKSRLMEIFKRIETETDISALQMYFSYKHFYVIYRKFWELDTDHDMLISIGDLSRYGHGCLSTRALRRIFQTLQGPIFDPTLAHHSSSTTTTPSHSTTAQDQSSTTTSSTPSLSALSSHISSSLTSLIIPSSTKTPLIKTFSTPNLTSPITNSTTNNQQETTVRRPNPLAQMMNFTQFVWFILSEEDKTTEQSWRYWFNIADRDGDGLISAYDIEYFYEEQIQRQRTSPGFDQQDFISFSDIMQQVTDLHQDISVSFVDLCRGGQGEMFFNLLFNLTKFLAMEYSNPFDTLSRRSTTNPWDSFVAHQYSIASLEESLSQAPSTEEDQSETPEEISSDGQNSNSSSSSSDDSSSDGELDPLEQAEQEDDREGLGQEEVDHSVQELIWTKRSPHNTYLSPSRSSSSFSSSSSSSKLSYKPFSDQT